ncbi:unnamed protein product [Zymoseptoria tritici ST99CH_3D1]|nr:unnamed protein product [Zymoseptoria tritici ST99CH_3D1]
MLFTEPRIPVLTALSVLVALTWVTLSLRLWVRLAVTRSSGWDDAFLTLSAIVFTGYCTSCVLIEGSGYIPRADDLENAQLSNLVNLVIANTELYIGTLVFLKIAIGSIYWRVATTRWQQYTVVTTLICSTAFGIIMFHLTLLNCGDPTRYLENAQQNACMPASSMYAMQMSAYIANTLTNWILAILPIFIVVKTVMSVPARLATASILTLGSCASLVALVRVIYLRDLTERPTFFHAIEELSFWSILECGLGTSAACAAALRPLFPSLTSRAGNEQFKSEASHTHKVSAASSSSSQQSDDVKARDWTTLEPLRIPFYEAEGQSKSHFSVVSVTPAIRRLRVLSRLGLSYFNLTGSKNDTDIPDDFDSANVVRRSTLEKSPVNGRLEMSRKLTVRENRPTTHRGESQQDLFSARSSTYSQ